MSSSSILPLLKQSFSEWSEDKASRLAAALAYYTAISLAPLLVLAVTMLKWFKLDGKEVVEGQLGTLMGPVGQQAAAQMIDSAKQSSGLIPTIISLVILMFGASGVFAELQDSMNTVWEVQPKPNLSWWDLVKARFFSLTMVFGVVFVMLVSLVISTILGALATRVAGEGKVVGLLLDVILSLIVYAGVFALLFKYLPDVKIRFRDVWLGAVVTAVLFTIGKYLLTWYLTKGSTASAYGAAGSLAALLIWVYYSSQILFFGAEFTQVYTRKYGSRIVPMEHAIPVTEEQRAQQGLVREHDLTTATAAAEAMAEKRGAVFGQTSAIPSPKVVTITRPAPGTTKAYAIAGGGLAAGLIVGAAGWFVGKKLNPDRAPQIALKNRLDHLEAKAGPRLRVLRKQLEVEDRIGAMEARVRDATTRVQKHYAPNWWDRIIPLSLRER